MIDYTCSAKKMNISFKHKTLTYIFHIGIRDVHRTVQGAYILKAGFAGFQNPQTIWNFPQKDCLRTRKISILQYVRNKGEEASSKTKVCRKVLHNM